MFKKLKAGVGENLIRREITVIILRPNEGVKVLALISRAAALGLTEATSRGRRPLKLLRGLELTEATPRGRTPWAEIRAADGCAP